MGPEFKSSAPHVVVACAYKPKVKRLVQMHPGGSLDSQSILNYKLPGHGDVYGGS